MEDQDVRSALKEYVTEAEPPVGLTGDGVLAAGRRSRRRRLTTVVAAVALAAAGFPAGTAIIALPERNEPAAASPCGAKSPEETTEAAKARLSCVLEATVRARVTLGSDTPFDLKAIPIGQGNGYHLVYPVRDGSLSVTVLPNNGTLLSTGTACRRLNPAPATCSASLIDGGTLVETTTKENDGHVTYGAAYQTGTAIVEVSADGGDNARPPLSEAQVREIALTPGLVP
ncbi:hypothetical protein SAMN04489729_2835 [Amycolatopsis lurida]|uniref:Uncharacterized protein n=1 Tax=Amycolatopsis lurida NRRL 2430 TaxID=1460371 RepID=A0A2P2FN94_AMYLU|nr:hypothetical protein [Amycolatopsis lurida]KFU78190.1 hypothetical protein BB31_26465 [Amycolatopsis lurida NRRL 2430]SEC92935.1 hypothetical protein SAMN04489729_2835 [Amycolatopsis lurida]